MKPLKIENSMSKEDILLSKVDYTSVINYMRLSENKVHDLYELYESLV